MYKLWLISLQEGIVAQATICTIPTQSQSILRSEMPLEWNIRSLSIKKLPSSAAAWHGLSTCRVHDMEKENRPRDISQPKQRWCSCKTYRTYLVFDVRSLSTGNSMGGSPAPKNIWSNSIPLLRHPGNGVPSKAATRSPESPSSYRNQIPSNKPI